MCDSNTCKQVEVINPKQSKKIVMVDACIADEIQELNDKGVLTLGCCCGHGKAGQIQIYQNESGSWKEIISPPIALIDEQSIYLAKKLEYIPFPFYYANGQKCNIWQMHLKSGCITEKDCREWHLVHAIPCVT
ncbi:MULTISPECIES: hypothetical protein [unclassified Dehalobacter]|jgi:hypothetical protein|uniref:hypothetical protein n=1 Tax=unclassified Dehalobacter TaxID=2635733 RepID=UPI00059E0B13|nr:MULTISPECIES: hypothetical protein [unclassified Dehalobacter]